MPYVTIGAETELFYEDHGEGTPVIFIHGVLMSSKFFHKQIPYFKEHYRTIVPDLRGHGKSSKVQAGHTVPAYANDLKEFISKLGVENVILVGWSMGAFVIWDYINQFGTDGIKAISIVDQSPSDFNWPDWDFGAFDLEAISGVMAEVQTNREQFYKGFIGQMLRAEPKEEDTQWMLEEMLKLPASVASTIVFNQTVVDYRTTLSNADVPALLCFGRDQKFFPVAAGEYIQARIPGSKLEVFENSSHCPFLEEPEAFNATLDQFIKSVQN